MSTVEAVLAAAEATSGVIVLEAWNDQTITRLVEFRPQYVVPGEVNSGIADEILTNPARIIIPRPETEMSGTRGIDFIVSAHGLLSKIESPDDSIVDLVRSELLDNPQWPLNKTLRESDLVKPFTVDAATKLLTGSYGMLPVKDAYLAFGIKREKNIDVTLEVSKLKGKTVRELVFMLISKAKLHGAYFRIRPMSLDPDSDYSTSTSFQWSLTHFPR